MCEDPREVALRDMDFSEIEKRVLVVGGYDPGVDLGTATARWRSGSGVLDLFYGGPSIHGFDKTDYLLRNVRDVTDDYEFPVKVDETPYQRHAPGPMRINKKALAKRRAANKAARAARKR